MTFSSTTVTHLLDAYGYWAIGAIVAVESAGIPFPGETVLVAAATYAGKEHRLDVAWIIAAAAAGAILGDNLGYLAGRALGFRLLRRYGRAIRVNERRLKLGVWLFRRYGVLVVFLGRFVAVLRAWAAFLAGTNRMPWGRFVAANAGGGVLWATAIALLAYAGGEEAARLSGAAGWVLLALGAVALVAGARFVRRHEKRLEDEAERAMPGKLDQL